MIIDFFKNMDLSNFGIGVWEILAIIVLVIMGQVLINRFVLFLPTRTGNLIKTIVSQALSVFLYGLIVLVILNAMLTGDYRNVFMLPILAVSTNIDNWYKLYDKFVDKRLNREQ